MDRRLKLEERIWAHNKYIETKSYKHVQDNWPFDSKPPHKSAIHSLVKKFRETGSIEYRKGHNRKPRVRTQASIENEQRIIQSIRTNGKQSLRKLSKELGIPKTTVRSIITKPDFKKRVGKQKSTAKSETASTSNNQVPIVTQSVDPQSGNTSDLNCSNIHSECQYKLQENLIMLPNQFCSNT